jgi:hypothetical protein
MDSNKTLSEFGKIVDRLHDLSEKLIVIIDKQIESVMSSEPEDIEEYVKDYSDLRGIFKDEEHKFINHLQRMINNADVENIEIRLKDLKKVYPDSEKKITDWQKSLESQMQKLQEKHQKLNELLEFAVERNSNLMHSIYQLQNEKNTRYGAQGNKEEISSGIALNKQA